MSAVALAAADVASEDRLRAHFYQLLGRLLAAPPDRDLLELARGLEGDDSDLGRALHQLAVAARSATEASAAREYQDLFIGLGRGELVAYGSYYLTGFLNEKPLAKLRVDMSRLGIARAETVKEPEDHIASECEMMAGLILGWFGEPLDLPGQRAFFRTHLEPWVGRFFEDLETANAARFYRTVGTLGRAFIAIEETAFDMGG